MDQIAVNAAVSIFEGVDVDEAEGEDRRGDNRIEALRGAAVERDHAVDQRFQVLGPGADVIGQRHAVVAVMLADEAALLPEAELHEAGVAEHDPLQAQQLIAIKRLTTGLADGAAPALDAVLRRTLALDRVAGPRVLE